MGLKIVGLSKKFGDRMIFEDFQMTAASHEVLALVGPSGGGKTTLLRILAGLETLDAGEIWLDDQRLTVSKGLLKNSPLGVVFQDFQLFPHMTVMENLTLSPIKTQGMSRDAAREKALGLLGQLELTGFDGVYPFSLSGGQKQRVALARALMMNPEILGYDEPTSALDPALTGQVAELILANRAAGITQIVVTHDMDFAEKIADKIVKINPK